MKCYDCGEEKNENEVLPGWPIICKACFSRINRISPDLSPEYYQGFRDGKAKGTRDERNRLRKIAFTRGKEELLEVLNIR